MTAIEESVQVPPGEKQAINKMSEKLNAALAEARGAKPAAKAIAPTEPPAPKAPEPPKPVNNVPAEPPKPAETKTEPKPSETTKSPEAEKSPSRENFAKLESEAKRWREEANKLKPEFEKTQAEAAQLRTQLETMSKLEPEYKQVKEKLQEYEKIVKEFYVERDPQFQAHFGQRIQTAVLEAKEAVGAEHAAKIEQVLQVPPSHFRDQQVAELAEGLNDFSKAALVSAYTELKRAERERKAELSKSQENYQKLQEVQAKRQQEESAKAAESRNALLAHVNSQIEPELDGADPEVATSIKDNVKRMVSGEMDAKGYTNVLVYAARGQKSEALIKFKDEQIAKLEAQIAEMTTANPTLGGGGASTPKAKPGEFDDIGAKFRKARDGK